MNPPLDLWFLIVKSNTIYQEINLRQKKCKKSTAKLLILCIIKHENCINSWRGLLDIEKSWRGTSSWGVEIRLGVKSRYKLWLVFVGLSFGGLTFGRHFVIVSVYQGNQNYYGRNILSIYRHKIPFCKLKSPLFCFKTYPTPF